MTNIFLVDDHEIVRQGLHLLIDAAPDLRVVGEAAGGDGLTQSVRQAGADIVIMDVSMPGIAGAEATAEIRKSLPGVKVIALTRHTERAYVQQMIRAGASGYILKQNDAAVLIAAIRAVVRGGTFLDPAVAASLVEALTPRGRDAGHAPAELTAREQEVATLVARGHSNKEIAGKLGIGVKTVETHKANVMEKLELTSRSELVQYALDHGWLGRGPTSD